MVRPPDDQAPTESRGRHFIFLTGEKFLVSFTGGVSR